MKTLYTHILVDRDGETTAVNNPKGIGAETYITDRGDYIKANKQDILLAVDEDTVIDLSVFVQKESK